MNRDKFPIEVRFNSMRLYIEENLEREKKSITLEPDGGTPIEVIPKKEGRHYRLTLSSKGMGDASNWPNLKNHCQLGVWGIYVKLQGGITKELHRGIYYKPIGISDRII